MVYEVKTTSTFNIIKCQPSAVLDIPACLRCNQYQTTGFTSEYLLMYVIINIDHLKAFVLLFFNISFRIDRTSLIN
jgi:hypothetical protein